MTTIGSPAAAPGATATPIAASGADNGKLKQAAHQFEAIFMRQMLAAARTAKLGGDGIFDSKAIDTFREQQDARFAEIAADRDVLGLAKMIEKQLAARTGAAPSATAAASVPSIPVTKEP